MSFKPRDALFFGIFGLFSLTAWGWLLLGAAPLLAAASETLHAGFHSRGGDHGLLAEIARNVAQASHAAPVSWQSLFDYIFSFFNLGLGLFLLKLRPFDATARLLSIGMIGTAIAFNLQGHDALQVVPVDSLIAVNTWHVGIHIVSGLCYMFALLLFPSGRLRSGGRSGLLILPLLLPVALFFTVLSMITADDHTLGLVIVFGVFIPVAGITAQVLRFRRADSPEQRQQSKVLLFVLLFAVLIAIPLVAFTESLGTSDAKTVTYEVTAPPEGTYFFRCDPHPGEMQGEVRVAPPGSDAPDTLHVRARNNRFDTDVLRMEAAGTTTIRFTNEDGDLHNIALYDSARADDPIFIGQEFSGRETAAFAFRVFRLVFIIIPIALFTGLIRFHLWDIDRVLNRTLVYGALASIITIVYLALVVGLGTVFGAGRNLNLALSIVVTALLAATFQPLRDRARKVANRLVYGRRATPYEVLSAFSERVGNSYALEDAIPEMAKALGEGTHAKRAEIWLRVNNQLVRSAAWPPGSGEGPSGRVVPLQDGGLPDFDETNRAVPVAHRGEFLGALTVTKPRGQSVTPVEDRLLQDVAAQAGLVLRNAQLTAELRARLDQLRESRQRIVAAQDAERRRLERNIHDGAQQHLVALSMKLRLAQELATTDPERAQALLEELQGDTGEALQTLRDLARGIYPPVLADKGLVQALEAHARRCPVPVTVVDEGVGRHPADLEAAAYFCCLEAIQNAIKHAGATAIEVEVWESDRHLGVRVSDRGTGFDAEKTGDGSGIQNMRDRVAALGGALDIASAPETGTSVEARIPTPHGGGELASEVETTPD